VARRTGALLLGSESDQRKNIRIGKQLTKYLEAFFSAAHPREPIVNESDLHAGSSHTCSGSPPLKSETGEPEW
jgi:hypothetical protein